MKTFYKIIYFFIIFSFLFFILHTQCFATSEQINEIEAPISNSINYPLSDISQSQSNSVTNEPVNNDSNDDSNNGDEDVIDEEIATGDDEEIDGEIDGDDEEINSDDLDQTFGSSMDDAEIEDGDEEEDYEEDDDENNSDDSVNITYQQLDANSSYNLPKTGISSTLIVSMLLIALFGIYSFYKFSNQDF